MTLHYFITPEIFEKFPGFCRGVVIAYGIQNGPSPDGLIAEIRAAEKELSAKITPDQIINHPNVACWRDAYRTLGIKPSDYRPSVEALARRVMKNDPLPAINTVVDIGNLVSIRRMIPIGAHAIDKLTKDICVRPAAGAEIFEPFGAETVEHPSPGEFIFVEGDIVLTRRWVWRQSKHTLMMPETTAVEINVDGLLPVTQGDVEVICKELVVLVEKYCGGKARFEILSPGNPSIEL